LGIFFKNGKTFKTTFTNKSTRVRSLAFVRNGAGVGFVVRFGLGPNGNAVENVGNVGLGASFGC